MIRHSGKGMHKSGIWDLGGSLNEIASPSECPTRDAVECVNWKVHRDGKSKAKRPGYGKLDTDYTPSGEPIIQIHEYKDANNLDKKLIITPHKIIVRKDVAGYERKYLSETTTDSFVHSFGIFEDNLIIADIVATDRTIVKKTSDGETWTDLFETTAYTTDKYDFNDITEFGGSLWFTQYHAATGVPKVLEWDGTQIIEHLADITNYHAVNFIKWDGKLWVITDVTPSTSNNKRVIYYWNGVNWSEITNYDGASYLDYNYATALGNYYNQVSTKFFVWKNELYLFDLRYNPDTSKLIEDCEDAWDEYVNSNVTSTADTADKQVGTASVKLDVATGAVAGDILATEALNSLDLRGFRNIKFWIKCSVATAAGDLKLLIDDTPECASPVKEFSVPALVADTWKEVTIALNDTEIKNINSVGLKYVTDLGACVIHLDDIRVIGADNWQVWKFKQSTYDQFNKVFDSSSLEESYGFSCVFDIDGEVYVTTNNLTYNNSNYLNDIKLYKAKNDALSDWEKVGAFDDFGCPFDCKEYDGRIYLNCHIYDAGGTDDFTKIWYFDKINKNFFLETTITTNAHNSPGNALAVYKGELYVGKYKEVYKRVIVSNEWTDVYYTTEEIDLPPTTVDEEGRVFVGGFGENLIIEGENVYTLGIVAPAGKLTATLIDGEPVVDEIVGVGDGTEKEFNAILDEGLVIQKSSIVVTYTIGTTSYDATDDGEGVITGTDCTGTIDYKYKTISLTFTTAPADGKNIVCDYRYSNLGNSEYKYIATFSRSGNYPCEGNPSPESIAITPYGQKVSLSNIPISSDPKVNRRRIYRTKAGGAIFYWLDDIDDNSTTTYIDNYSDSSLGDEVSYDRLPPPKGKFFEVWDSKLWIAGNPEYPNLLFFTNTGTSEEFTSTNFLNIKRRESDIIMQIKAFGDNLYTFKRKSWFGVSKFGTSLYEVNQMPQKIGTDASYSVVVCDKVLMWKSELGIEVFNGMTNYRPIPSEIIQRTMDSINKKYLNKCIGGHNEIGNEYWLSVPTGSNTEQDKTIVFDYLRNIFTIYEFAKGLSSFSTITYLGGNLVNLLGTPDGSLYIHSDNYASDDGTPINAHFKTGWINVTGQQEIWNILRRMFIKYILPEKKVKEGELLGVGDGAKLEFNYTALNLPVNKSSLKVKYTIASTDYEAVDDGEGAITGTKCSGTINYSTGAISLTFTTAPDNETNITIDYETSLNITMKIYRNFKKTPIASIDLAGFTPTSEVELRNEILRLINLGIRGYYVMFEFMNNQDCGGECKIMGWDWYFKRKLWKRTLKGD